MTVSRDEVAELRRYLRETEAALDPVIERDGASWDVAHQAITALLAGFPSPGLDVRAGELRSAQYLNAVGDLPAWPVALACKLWNRHQAGSHDYTWAPSPPILRSIAEREWKPARDQAEKLTKLIAAIEARPADYVPPEIARPVPGKSDPDAVRKSNHIAGHAARVLADIAARKQSSEA